MSSERFPWLYVWLLLVCLFPALLCQSIVPIVPIAWWENLSESFYTWILSGSTPADNEDSRRHKVNTTVIKITAEDRKQYGWPISEAAMVQFLNKLKYAGNPWLLSLFPMQFSKHSENPPVNTKNKKKNLIPKNPIVNQWEVSLKNYNRFIATSFLWDSSEYSFESPSKLGNGYTRISSKIAKSISGKNISINDLPVKFLESASYIENARLSGASVNLKMDEINLCLPTYYTDTSNQILALTAPIIAYSAYSRTLLQTRHPIRWPAKNDKLSISFKKKHRLSEYICFKHPTVNTSDYFKFRNINVFSFSDIMNLSISNPQKGQTTENNPLISNLKNKLIILTSDDTHVAGPASIFSKWSGMVTSDDLIIRFIDSLLTDEFLSREPLDVNIFSSLLPFLIGLVLSLLLILTNIKISLITCLSILSILITLASYNVFIANQFNIYIQSIISSILSLLGLLVAFLVLKKYSFKRLSKFAETLRDHLGQCNSFEDIKLNTQSVCASEFVFFKIFFIGYDNDMYEAAVSPQAAVSYLQEIENRGDDLEETLSALWEDNAKGEENFSTVITSMQKAPKGNNPLGTQGFTAKIAISANDIRLGTIDVQLNYKAHEASFIAEMINVLASELASNWLRVNTLTKQRLRDYSYLINKSRSNMVNHFLPKAIVNQFTDQRTITQNFKIVLKPKVSKIALLYADLGQYWHNNINQMSAEDLVKNFKEYYKGIIDASELIAKVKLIGDKVFAFIEDKSLSSDTVSISDIGLYIGSLLIRDLVKQNERQQKPLEFGISLHVGRAIVGNLGSDLSIDYTAVGTEIDKVARLEEITKNAKFKETTGINSLVMSEESQNDLIMYKNILSHKIDLSEINVFVRAFNEIKHVHYVEKDTLMEIARSSTLKRLAKL